MHSVPCGISVQILLCVGFGERKLSEFEGGGTYFLPSFIAACAERYSGRTFWTTAPYPSNHLAYDPNDNFPPFLTLHIKFEEAEAYRKAAGCYLRKNQWEDLTIHSLGEQLKPTGLLVITDTILNRVTLNWKKGKRTHIFIDEFHVVFENEQSGIFFNSAWRQFRKRNGYPTAITQNVEYLLDSVQASTMLSNSEFVVMLNQAYSDRAKLSKLLNISDEQMSYVTNADAGCGLIKYGSALVPFINRFPRDTKLYQLMTTKPGEGVFGGDAS